MWAMGAMAVEIATLKPLFPGGNEVDQVWRVCEIMGSPGNWYSKSGAKIGGGEWREGSRLAHKLGFTFPKMAPHAMESVLQPPQWPAAFSEFVTWCLMWDPKNRPTSTQALNHEYFADAVDPVRPKSSTSARLLGRKQSEKSFKSSTLSPGDSPTLSSKPSWFRRSLVVRSGSPAPASEDSPVRQSAVTQVSVPEIQPVKPRPANPKRATWASGAPMPILPSIRPVSPLSNSVTAQANVTAAHSESTKSSETSASAKIGRQLSVNSHGNHYSDANRQEAERMLNGSGSNTPTTKESFFSHLRKRARRLSGRNQSAPTDDVEANAGCIPWSNRSSMALDGPTSDPKQGSDLSELDKALQGVKYSLDSSALGNVPVHLHNGADGNTIKRQSMPQATGNNVAPISSRTRRAMQMSTHPVHRYETPEEEDELLDEVLHSASKAARRLAQSQSTSSDSHSGAHRQSENSRTQHNPYPTPSPTAKECATFGQQSTPSKLNLHKLDHAMAHRHWPTPPYEEAELHNKKSDYFSRGSNFI
ncbi:uncharacterized protein N7515_005430 [Penicillium bovifimosum]|uniref:Protein kinase domain-containing protein n=1 Tax=Penicillium bovifimosum TaxID=126998 RepID=A0A9W9GT05_9EURO|nr:uncharacterized protein N7515_005430 [Penicillium bovifimosum]KAJ5129391.1 hypothetical protein N7515_005430 [Penicillium bovifimosum]